MVEREIESRLPAEVLDEYRHTLGLVQTLNRGRESSKANWARACRTQRPPVVELGRRLAERGIIDDAEDIWFLRLPELRQAVESNLDGGAAKANIASRKEEFARMEQHELPVMFDWPVELIPKVASRSGQHRQLPGSGHQPREGFRQGARDRERRRRHERRN